jgi:hypothetical protein
MSKTVFKIIDKELKHNSLRIKKDKNDCCKSGGILYSLQELINIEGKREYFIISQIMPIGQFKIINQSNTPERIFDCSVVHYSIRNYRNVYLRKSKRCLNL